MTQGIGPRAWPPWRPVDLVLLVATTSIGLAVLATGWWGVSGTARLSHQLPWLNLAVAGLIVLGAGNGLWLMAGRRAIATRRRHLLDAWAHVEVATLEVHPNGSEPQPVWATGMTHYHRPTCQLVEGKGASAASVATHHRAGRQPCGMCRP